MEVVEVFDYFKGEEVPGCCPDGETYPEEEYPFDEEVPEEESFGEMYPDEEDEEDDTEEEY
ncbi:MAG: hypothetical protein WC180_07385 [Candidatus Paceibacterota bacterium]